MDLVTPGLGLFFWMLLSFSVVLFILSKFAWKPILDTLKKRESSIEEAINAAKKAKDDLNQVSGDKVKIINQAKEERDTIIKEAKDAKDKIIAEAKNQATIEVARLMEAAKKGIENEKLAAITEIKSSIATLSVEIAEKIIKKELESIKRQEDLVDDLLENINLN